jgi:hypothetical protein
VTLTPAGGGRGCGDTLDDDDDDAGVRGAAAATLWVCEGEPAAVPWLMP